MRTVTDYKGHKVICEWGYVAEKDVSLVVLGIDSKATIHRGSMVPNLAHHSFNMRDKENVCYLALAVNYTPKQISELVEEGGIDPPENLEQEVYLASLSAHSKNSGYLDTTVNWLKDILKWINMKQDIPEMQTPVQMTLRAHRELIDREQS